MQRTVIASARVDDEHITFVLSDGRVVAAPTAWSPLLLEATAEQRADHRVDDAGIIVEWPSIDEHIGLWTLLGVPEDVVLESADLEVHSPVHAIARTLEGDGAGMAVASSGEAVDLLTKPFYAPSEVAQLASLSNSTILNYIHQGRLAAVKLSERTYRIPRKAVIRLLGLEAPAPVVSERPDATVDL